MKKAEDLTGRRFGRLLVLSYEGTEKRVETKWLCKCDCGNEKIVGRRTLVYTKEPSCGCFIKEYKSKMFTKHGLADTRLNSIWKDMKQRCGNKNVKFYGYYGGRGIRVCEEWKNDFMAFYNWAMNNGYEDTLTLDRINTNGNYEPSNCRWVSWDKQANNKRSNVFIEYNGEKKTIKEWSKIYNIHYNTLRGRLYKMGWNIEDALTIPPDTRFGRKKVVPTP